MCASWITVAIEICGWSPSPNIGGDDDDDNVVNVN